MEWTTSCQPQPAAGGGAVAESKIGPAVSPPTETRHEESTQASAPQVVEPAEDLLARIDDLEAELDEARRGPWPEWAERILKLVRERSGYDGYDDQSEGVDLAEEVEECFLELERAREKAVAQASAPSVQVPDGWKLVPLKPTPEMWRAWDQAPFNEDGDIERNNAWAAMLAAAPEASAQPAAPNPWRDAVDAALVSAGLDCLAPDADPVAAVTSLIENEVATALDPALSEQARALIARGWSELEATHEALRDYCDEVAQPAAEPGAPSVEAAHAMGASGSPPVEAERLAFEAWVKGHCWALGAMWTGSGYIGTAETPGSICPVAMGTRRMWAAWRDRAALSTPTSPSDAQEQQP